MKEPLLYLCHRMPYPPNKGDKITTFHVLKFLSQHYQVYLGTFIDDPEDKQYRPVVEQYCQQAFFVELVPHVAKLRGMKAFVTGEPITLPYYQSLKMQQWVMDVVAQQHISKMFIYSACMAQYVLHDQLAAVHKIMQFADIDSDKWRQFADKQHFLMRLVYLREHKKLADYEQTVAAKFDLSCFISDAEVAMFKSMLTPALHDKIKPLCNGIDSDYFSPHALKVEKAEYDLQDENYLVFTGAMDYVPNADSVIWFVETLWQRLHQAHPDSAFYIVGSSPSAKVRALTKYAGVVVTGRVADVRPYLHHAKAAVAPMQMARGIQNKILEAMAMALPVLTTSLGAEGLENCLNQQVYVTDDCEQMYAWLDKKLSSPHQIATESRNWLKENYSWEAKLNPLLHYLGG